MEPKADKALARMKVVLSDREMKVIEQALEGEKIMAKTMFDAGAYLKEVTFLRDRISAYRILEETPENE